MSKIAKKLFTKTSFYYMSKGLDVLLKNDSNVKDRLAIIDEGTKIKLTILGQKDRLILVKKRDGFAISKNNDFDLSITFKFFGSLPKIVFGKSSVTDCYLSDEFFVQGELRYAVAMVCAIEQFMAYLLPKKRYQKVYGRPLHCSMKKGNMFFKLLFARRDVK